VAGKEPEIGPDIQLRCQEPFLEGAAGGRDLRDAVEHQHRRQGQPCVARPEQTTVPAFDQLFVGIARLGDETRLFGSQRRIHASGGAMKKRDRKRNGNTTTILKRHETAP